ncbi:MAG: 30S ribosomal protein S13 [Parcubacteria group bacterium GW2011_GWC1_42_11]|uniref:Small ribosomal subunit protein uS13 n=1 Tax=Candidatus Nomurabacteria bacterium GW2011_GWC2_42_20 TaxID=1618756 RepID=A0A0G1CD61_9BACT|nr:MAG: 30S ribosomal protein S13 [Parcubacteria group bacterium GW2011_GWC1_42_11]KKS47583.1 MAG: 30S ribosomal protein S13 [Candidatus Nomurabacteria bacterium GW2011_GWC2_42_20]KKS58988.1 MAG: 30S ribosomal protein S13 [Candidatus Nomurabacteria bacterium GW2011_GWA2_42_41]KKT09552.1 MAG: 30S ribosomal protein S13 [Candidatus Nomurabacteria bacterium GW2011_GWB1_43_20]TAN35919.1 MAG: 30S ribosomal protein S13 [Patescibacteria group bacterium]HBH71505.1 30S ribosomal protein S13 [Candidatus 
MRILGVTIPDEKRLEISLTAVYGIGRPRAKKLLDEVNIEHGKLAKDLTPDDEAKIRKIIEGLTLEGDLKREISTNVKRLKEIKSHRGSRHAKKLPVRGQRTKTNSRTVRGNKRTTMGSGRRKADKK